MCIEPEKKLNGAHESKQKKQKKKPGNSQTTKAKSKKLTTALRRTYSGNNTVKMNPENKE